MEKTLIVSDIAAAYPVLVLPIGEVSDDGRNFLNVLDGEIFSIECFNSFEQFCKSKNFLYPRELNASIYVCSSDSNFLILKKRLESEKDNFHLKCFVVVGFIDFTLNKDVHMLKEFTKNYASQYHEMNYIIYRADQDNDILKEHSEHTHISFYTFNQENAVINIRQFLTPLIFQSIEVQISLIPDINNTSYKAAKNSISSSVIPRLWLYMMATDKSEKETGFLEIFKYLEKNKDPSNTNKYGILSQIIGTIEQELPHFSRDSKFLDRFGSFTPMWSISNENGEQKNDSVYLFSIAAGIYSNLKDYGKVVDCIFHILKSISSQLSQIRVLRQSSIQINAIDQQSRSAVSDVSPKEAMKNSFKLNNGTNGISKLIHECSSIICANVGGEFMDYRAWELIEHVKRLGLLRRIPLLNHEFSQAFKEDTRLDFVLAMINNFYNININQNAIQGTSNDEASSNHDKNHFTNTLFLKTVCASAIDSLLSYLEPAAMAQIIYRFLSAVGPDLSKEYQMKLFSKLSGIDIGGIQIPLFPGFKTKNLIINKMPVEALVSEKNNGSKSPRSVFLYNSLQRANENERIDKDGYPIKNIIIRKGSQIRITFELYNPFLLDLPVHLLVHNDEQFSSADYPNNIIHQSWNEVICCFTPLYEGEHTIDSIDCAVYQGIQSIKLPTKLQIHAVSNIADFKIRTDLPLEKPLELYHGELINVGLWVTNTCEIPIENLMIKSDQIKMQYDNIKLPIVPYDGVFIPTSIMIDKNIDQICFDVFAQTSNKHIATVSHVVQPLKVMPGISIVSIDSLKLRPDIDFDFFQDCSKKLFIGVSIKNFSSDSFSYSISFKESALEDSKAPYDNFYKKCLPSIVTRKKTKGLLSAYKTKLFILVINKDTITASFSKGNNPEKVAAVKSEEKRKGRQLSGEEREILKKRVDIASFIKSNLEFSWKCSDTRKGSLTNILSFPSENILSDLNVTLPTIHYTTLNSNEDGTIPLNKIVTLRVNFTGIAMKACKLSLGIFKDDDYGILWNGSLKREINNQLNETDVNFDLYFTKSGVYEFRIEYITSQGTKGKKSISFKAQSST